MSHLAFHGHPPAVGVHDVLDDGQAQARAARGPGAGFVHPVKPLKNAGQVGRGKVFIIVYTTHRERSIAHYDIGNTKKVMRGRNRLTIAYREAVWAYPSTVSVGGITIASYVEFIFSILYNSGKLIRCFCYTGNRCSCSLSKSCFSPF